MLAAWLNSNYWDTNYAASFQGRMAYRFVIQPGSGGIDNGAANRFAEEVAHPFIVQPVSCPL